MADYIFPEVTANSASMTLEANTGVFRADSGALQTSDRSGERWLFQVSHQNLTGADRRKLMAFIARLNGQEHRAYIRDFSYSGPSGTLSTISNLHVPLSATGTGFTSFPAWLEVSDTTFGVRLYRNGNTANGSSVPIASLTTVSGVSYCHRVAIVGNTALAASNKLHYGADYTGGAQTAGGLANTSIVNGVTDVSHLGMTAPGTSTRMATTDQTPTTSTVTGYSQWDLERLELARCLLIDNGVNELTYSEQFDNAAWQKSDSSVSANPSPGASAPDASDTADELIESATGPIAHYIYQSHTRASAAEFWTGSVFIKKNTNQRIRLSVYAGSNDGGSGWFDADTGTVTQETLSAPGESLYTSIHDYGNGWYRCRVSVRLPASTTAQLLIWLCDGASNTTSYAGDGSSGLYIWGAQLQQGGQLGRYVQTTTAAATAASQTGSEIWVKGLDADTDGQLLAGDQVQIGDQLCILESDLDGDESGVGLMVVRNRIRTAPSDEDPVVLYRPCGKFILANNANSWENRPGVFSGFGLSFIEDFAA